MPTVRSLLALLVALSAAPALAAAGPRVDTDYDGVSDAADAFPCDWRRSAVSFVPSEGELGTLLFEDNWPSQGDLDLNDAVVAYHYAVYLGADGRATGLRLTVVPRALGASLRSGLALHLALPAGVLRSAALAHGGATPAPVASTSGEPELDFVLAPDLRALFGDATGFINTMPVAGSNPGDAAPLVLELDFSEPVALSAASDPFDLYFFRTEDRGHQVHRPKFGGTATMNTALFGTADDGSSGGRRFVDRDGLPFILDIPALSTWPREQVRVETVWPSITRFARTAGAEAADYYAQSTSNTFFITAAKPEALPPSYAQCLAPSCSDGARNGLETDLDCGAACGGCAAGAGCLSNSDCASGACSGGSCLTHGSRICTLEHGVGEELATPSGWEPCRVTQCDLGYHIEANTCAPDTRGCLVDHGTGVETFAGTDFGPCVVTACSGGFHLEAGACAADVRTCAFPNGSGTQSYAAGTWGACVVGSCAGGFHVEAGACASDSRACAVAHGSGAQTWTGAGYGACAPTTCDPGYRASGNACVAVVFAWTAGAWGACGGGSAAPSYGAWGSCTGGAGQWSYGAWGACTAGAVCSGSGVESRNATCAFTADSGTQTRPAGCAWTSASGLQTRSVVCTNNFGEVVDGSACSGAAPELAQACTPPGAPSSCGALVTSQACTPSDPLTCGAPTTTQPCSSPAGAQACAVPNGVGTQTCASGGTTWSACAVSSCNAAFHVESGACAADVRACSVSNGSGTQTWSGGAYGACIATSCVSGFHVESGACANDTRSCAVANGSGVQTWTGSGYGACTTTSCATGYHFESGACASDTRSCAITHGTGTQSWTGTAYGACTLASCDSGYRASSGSCVLLTYAWTSGVWGACASGSASPSYGAWGTCTGGSGSWSYGAWGACSASAVCSGSGAQTRSATCNFTASSGAQTRSGGCAWDSGSGSQTRAVACMNNFGETVSDGACATAAPSSTQACTPGGTPSSCGTLVTAQACTPSDSAVCGAAATSQGCTSPAGSRSCAITNGTGTQSCAAASTTWGTCTLVSCNSSFHLESGACVSDTRSCAFTDGTGTESWNGTAWGGVCTLASCNASYHAESGACVTNTRSCAFTNGTGTQTWTGSAYGTCTVATCNSGFHVESGACAANARSCTLSNGAGVQNWTGSAWGACLALSCAGLADGAGCQDTDACSSGETCRGGSCVGPSAITYAVIESPGMTFPGNAWTSPAWNNTRMASGISLSGSNIYFGSTGVYRVTLSYRHGNGPDVWTQVRLFGNSVVRGTSAGYGNVGTYNPNLFTTTFLATVDDPTIPYQVQLGRQTSAVTVDTTGATIGTDALPSIQATLQKIDELGGGESYVNIQGGAQTFAANAWTDVYFQPPAQLASGISIPMPNLFSFTNPGVYRVTLSWRFGSGSDVWSGVRLQGARDTVGTSAAFANPGSNSNLYTVDFLATVRDVSQTYRIQVGRLNATMAVDGVPQAIAGFTPPRVQATLQRVGDLPGSGTPLRAYAQLEGQTQVAAANGWTGISFDRAAVASGIGLSGANLTFPRAGVYRVSLSYRLGSGTDVWTAVRLHDGVGTRGISAGFGNFTDTQSLFTSTFLARVVDPSRTHQIQLGRLNNAQTLWTGPTVAGTELPGVVATIEEVRTLGCGDGSDCTADTCDATLGCQNTALPTGSSCEAGSRCTADTCQAGGCASGSAESCDDANPCTAELCSAAGGCSSTAVADGVACSDGSANTSGDTCQSAVCVGTTVTPHAVLESPVRTFPANVWTAANWTSTRFSQGISASGANLTFPSAGVYRINMTWRFGAGPDVWTAVRLFGDGASRGISAGFGNTATNNPSATEVSFLARIDNPAVTYQIQLGRLSSALTMNSTPLDIAGMTPAALQASVTRVGDLPGGTARYAQLEGPIMTFAANSWTSAAWTNVPVSNGVSVSGSNINFNQTGVYRVTLSWRFGNGGDVWTAIRLFGGSRTVGTSAGFGNSGYQPNLFTASFLANVDDVSVPYALQMGRLTSADQLDVVPGTIAGQAPPALQATLERVGDLPTASSSARAYGQFEAGQQTFTGSYWAPVFFSGTTFSSGITANSRFLRVARPGTYRVSIGYRFGSGDDVWTGVRLQGATTVGQSAAVGNIANTSNLVTITFLARITDANRNYELQVGRLVGPQVVNATPLPIVGIQTPAISVSMEEL